jgi:hypothetical protein
MRLRGFLTASLAFFSRPLSATEIMSYAKSNSMLVAFCFLFTFTFQSTDSRKSIAAGRNTRPEELVMPSPVMLGMSLSDSDNMRISPDKKSLIHKKAGWTWTFTPSIKK